MIFGRSVNPLDPNDKMPNGRLVQPLFLHQISLLKEKEKFLTAIMLHDIGNRASLGKNVVCY